MRRYINTGPHWALFGPEEALAFNFIGGHGSMRAGQGIIDEGENRVFLGAQFVRIVDHVSFAILPADVSGCNLQIGHSLRGRLSTR